MTQKKKKKIKQTLLSKKKRVKFSLKMKLDKVNWEKVEKVFTTDKKEILAYLRKNKETINPRAKDILLLLAGGAVLGLSLLIPAAPMALAPILVGKNKFNNRYFNQTLNRLSKQKLVEVIYENGEPVVKITQEGRIRALRYKLAEIVIKKPQRWDKKWRIVVFDIPEKYKRTREIFRQHLKIMDFYPLQKSVWLHPYPCFDEIEFLRQIYGVGIDVTYIVAERVEDSDGLRERYEL